MWDKLKRGDNIKGRVQKVVKSGFLISIRQGGTVFLPYSQVKAGSFDLETAPSLVGLITNFKIMSIDLERPNMVVSLREAEKDQTDRLQAVQFKRIKCGDVCVGKAVNVVDYGVFVDINNLTGLLHKNDMGEIDHPSEVVAEGQEMKVVVLEKDEENERVSFGLI